MAKFWTKGKKETHRDLERKIARLEKQIEGGREIIQRTSYKCTQLINCAKQQEAHVQTMAAYMVTILKGTIFDRSASKNNPWIIAKADITGSLKNNQFMWKESDDKEFIHLWVEGIKRTIDEWAALKGMEIIDADGFNRSDPEMDKKLYTEEEFDERICYCTIKIKEVDVDGSELESPSFGDNIPSIHTAREVYKSDDTKA